MSGVSRWRESGHLERAVETAGGQEAFDASVAAMLDDARGWRLAEMRKRRRPAGAQLGRGPTARSTRSTRAGCAIGTPRIGMGGRRSGVEALE